MPVEEFGGAGGAGKFKGISGAGNTSGTVSFVSTGTLYLAGGNNITISQDHNSLTIQGGVNTGATTFLAGVQNLGNTLGNTGTVNNQLILAGGNNVTLSESRNANSATVTIIGNNPQTGISSIQASDTTYTSGKVIFTGAGAVTVSSGANQSVIINAPVQSAQAIGTGSFGMSNLGNTAGTTGVATGTGPRFVIVGGSNVTLSQTIDAGGSSATVTINAQQVTGFVNSISVLGNTVGDVTAGTGRLILAGGNNITLSGGTAAGAMTLTISAGASGTAGGFQSAGVSSGGNTAGTTGLVSSQLLLFGGANITLSQSSAAGGATVTLVGAAAGSGAGINGLSASDTLYTSGSVRFTGGGIVTVQSGTGQLVIINASAAGGIAASLSGNSTSSGSGYTVINSGTMYLAGGNNVTLSQNGNSITISGADGGGAGMAGSGNSAGTVGIAASQLYFVGGSNISLSQSLDASSNNATITINGASGGAGGGGIAAGMTNTGNTSGTQFSSSTGTLFFAGTNNITISASTGGASVNTLWISGPTGGGAGMGTGTNTSGTSGSVAAQLYFYGNSAIGLSQSVSSGSASLTIIGQSGGGGGGVAIAGSNASTKTAGTVIFANSNNVTFGLSSDSITASFSGGGGGIAAGMTNTGNTSGTQFSSSTGTLFFQGTNNITVSASTGAGSVNTLWISGPTGGGAGMGNSANTSGTSGSVGKELYFYGGANISLSQSVNGSSGSLWIVGASGGSGGAGNIVSAGGNTSGTMTSFSSGTLVFAGGNNITLSQSSNTITISGPVQLAFTGGVSSGGNTSGNTGSVNNGLVFAGGNNITLSQGTGVSGATITIVGGAGGGGVAAGMTNTGNTSGNQFSSTTGTVFFAGTNNITLSASTGGGSVNTIWISGPSGGGAGMGTGTNTSGTAGTAARQLYFYGNSNVGLSQSLDGGSLSGSLTIIGNAGGGGGVAIAGSNASTKTAGTLNFAASNNITFGMTSDSMTASYSATNTVSINGSTGAISLNAGNLMSLSTVASSLTFINVLSSSATAAPVSNVSSAGSLASRFALADHAHQGVGGLVVSNTATTWVGNVMLSGTNITFVTGGNSTAGSLGISAAAAGGGAALGVTNTGNTAGTNFTTTQGTVYFQGTNNITVSNSTAANVQTLWISGPSGGGAGMGNTSYTSGTSGSVAKQLYFYPGPGVGLSQSMDGASNSGSLTIGQQFVSSFENMPAIGLSVTSSVNVPSTSHAVAFDLPSPGSFSFLRIPIALSTNSTTLSTAAASANMSVSVVSTWNAVVYSLGTGGSSRSLISVASGSAGGTILNSLSYGADGSSGSYTQSVNFPMEGGYSSLTTQYTVNNTNESFTTNQIFTAFSGSRWLDIPFANSLSPGPYWLVFGLSTNSGSNSARISAASNCLLGYSRHYVASQADLAFGVMGSTNLTSGGILGAACFSTAGGGTTSGFPISALSSSASNNRMYFQLIRSA